MKIYTIKKESFLLLKCLVFISFSVSSFGSTISNSKYLENSNLEVEYLITDSISKVVTFPVSNEVTISSALQIDEYMKQREGVISCITDPVSKISTLILEERMDTQLINQLLKYAEHLYVIKKCSSENH